MWKFTPRSAKITTYNVWLEYGKGMNKGTLKVVRKCGNAVVKVRLCSTNCAKRALIVFKMYLK